MELKPITRQEKIIAGQDLTPITRMEMFLKNFGGGGGGSAPKPLTFDYMPEGYPKKSVLTTTLMEERELAFAEVKNSVYGSFLAPPPLNIVGGHTYMVSWDGVEYECLCADDDKQRYLGNKSIFGSGNDTGEPFLYDYYQNVFATLDTAASHTISVKTTEEAVTPMAVDFIPATIQRVGDDVILSSSTSGSTKKFKITVDDSGTISATAVT